MDTKPIYVHKTEVHNLKSPDVVVPLLLKILNPRSVLDIGCGIGTWLHAFKMSGVNEVFGIDGDYVDRTLLKDFISTEEFRPTDLTYPFDLKRKFDLAICLEVAEHLPESSATDFIHSICLHADTIIFSAAIPGQGGQNHINEHWMTYWKEKFSAEGYKLFDILRSEIWNNPGIDWWYKQNMVVFSKQPINTTLPELPILNVVHPELFQKHIDYIIYLQQYVRELESKLYDGL